MNAPLNADDYVIIDEHQEMNSDAGAKAKSAPFKFAFRDKGCDVGVTYDVGIARGTALAKAEFGPEVWAEHGDRIVKQGKESLYLSHICGMVYDPLAQFLDGADSFVSYTVEKRERHAGRFAPLYGRTEAGAISVPYSNGPWAPRAQEQEKRAKRLRLDAFVCDAMLQMREPVRADESDEAVALTPGAGRRRGKWFDDFVAYMPSHNYIFKPTREPWPGGSVDAILPKVKLNVKGKDGKNIEIRACQWLDQNQAVEQMTWAPGLPMLIEDRLVADGGWIARGGVTVFNLYKPPSIEPGEASKASRWVDHIGKVYPESADHIIKWLASRVQRPEIKINHAIVLGGNQGVGKDTILEPVKSAIGPWNFSEVSPTQMMGRFNGFLKSVILRVSEARDLGDSDRYAFYEHLKPVIAAPPDVLRVDEKHLREHSVFNVVGVVITTNNKSNGICLPADDRRHYVAWSDLNRTAFDEEYFPSLYGWYEEGGDRHVAAYLGELDLAGFNPKAPPPHTSAFWEIVDAGRAPEDSELADVLDSLGNPDAVTLRVWPTAHPKSSPSGCATEKTAARSRTAWNSTDTWQSATMPPRTAAG
jgi:hypothetical protein